MVTGRQGHAEEVVAFLDQGAERDNDARHRTAVSLADATTVGGDVGIGHQVAHKVLFEGLLPRVVAGSIRSQAEQFAT